MQYDLLLLYTLQRIFNLTARRCVFINQVYVEKSNSSRSTVASQAKLKPAKVSLIKLHSVKSQVHLLVMFSAQGKKVI